MSWQDWILSGGSLIFSIALIPTILGKEKPALTTSFLTGTVLLIFAFVYSTLALWFSVVSGTLTGLLWYVLLVQKYLQKKQMGQTI